MTNNRPPNRPARNRWLLPITGAVIFPLVMWGPGIAQQRANAPRVISGAIPAARPPSGIGSPVTGTATEAAKRAAHLEEDVQNDQLAVLSQHVALLEQENKQQKLQIAELTKGLHSLEKDVFSPFPGYHAAFINKGNWVNLSDNVGIRYYTRK